MLAHVNNVQPKAELPLVRAQKHSNAMPHRSPKTTTQRNLTGLYLGVEGGNQKPKRQSTLPMKSRGRGMPSRRIRTPTEERRYKKVEMLRSRDDRRGFSGNPVKHYQARGLASTDEMNRASMYPADSDQFWDVTRQTTRQFTAPPNSGVKHLEYLNPDPNDIISTYYPRAFDKSLDELLVQEIQKAVSLKKEVAGLVYCYNKICKGNTRALQNLLPSRGFNSVRPHTCLKTGFTIKSYQSPRQAEIDANFPKVQPRPKTVVGFVGDRPLVPSPYFFKLYNIPKTAGQRPTPTEQDHQIVAAPGAGCLSRLAHKHEQQAVDSQTTIKTTTLHAEELIPASLKIPAGTSTHIINKSADHNTTNLAGGKMNVTLPLAGKTFSQTDQSLENETVKETRNSEKTESNTALAESTEKNTNGTEDAEKNTTATAEKSLVIDQEGEAEKVVEEHTELIQQLSLNVDKDPANSGLTNGDNSQNEALVKPDQDPETKKNDVEESNEDVGEENREIERESSMKNDAAAEN